LSRNPKGQGDLHPGLLICKLRHSLISAYTGAIAGFPEDLEKANYWTKKKIAR